MCSVFDGQVVFHKDDTTCLLSPLRCYCKVAHLAGVISCVVDNTSDVRHTAHESTLVRHLGNQQHVYSRWNEVTSAAALVGRSSIPMKQRTPQRV